MDSDKAPKKIIEMLKLMGTAACKRSVLGVGSCNLHA